MIPAEQFRAALSEAGRPDLAKESGTNRAGNPTIRRYIAQDLPDDDLAIIWKALDMIYSGEHLDPIDRGRFQHRTPDAFIAWIRALEPSANHHRWHWCPVHDDWSAVFHPDCWDAHDG